MSEYPSRPQVHSTNAANVQDMNILTSDTLEYLLNHIFLPIRLPQSDDHDIEKDLAICDQILDHALAFQEFLSPPQSTAWKSIFKMVRTLRKLQSTSVLDVEELEFSMRDLIPGGMVIFARQNIFVNADSNQMFLSFPSACKMHVLSSAKSQDTPCSSLSRSTHPMPR